MAERPNFILFITDQQRADHLGCMGHPVLRTPNIDTLANAGTVWDRFYVASPVCMPNRASLMTCRMPSSHGVRCNGIPLDTRNVTFVELLRDAGYKTALIGKSHLQTFSGRPPALQRPPVPEGYHPPKAEAFRHDHDRYTVEAPDQARYDIPLPYYGFDHVELVTRHGDGCQGTYRQWLLDREPDALNLIGADNQLPHDYSCPQAVRTALPEELYSTSYIAERAGAWLDANANGDQPFFLMVSFPDPHHPFNPPGRYWDMYTPDDMPTPAAFDRDDWNPPPHVAGILRDRAEGRANLRAMGAIGTDAQEAREAQALTCGMISMIDDAVGRVRTHAGADRAVTMFTSDHGDHLGDHRMLFKGPGVYEEVTRVPFIWADPAQPDPLRTDTIGQTHDIGPTILDRARVAPAIGMQGQSLLRGGRDVAFVQYDHQSTASGLGHPPRIHTVRTRQHRLSLIDGVSWGELYDLDADPREFINLWDDPAHATTRAALIEVLARQEIAAVDHAPFPTAHA
ncbi:sulfatase-like hydrolase/transferase [uncultured Tateyamaria sp.]|uniref:sulfatase family protein n=1 Tax=Tateyamaria sp. 1078 TaxID=3417464 RepID=UPI00262AA21F|nr:sulfatase-like hydrolase/transferase [uncultured Tateyamaria sp.]